MVRKIVKDPFFLQQKSEPATEADKQVIQDLLDTLNQSTENTAALRHRSSAMRSITFRGYLYKSNY